MIVFGNINKINPKEFDEVWAIVRSYRYPKPKMIHVPELSPSWELFKMYLDMKENNEWNMNSFLHIYAPRFREEIIDNKKAVQKIDELISKHKHGKKIACVCYCKNPLMCHRWILKEMVADLHVESELE